MATPGQIRRLRERLIKVARKPDPRIAYSEIDHIVGLDVYIPANRLKLGRILGELGSKEVKAGRP